jgi:hypothetical protein
MGMKLIIIAAMYLIITICLVSLAVPASAAEPAPSVNQLSQTPGDALRAGVSQPRSPVIYPRRNSTVVTQSSNRSFPLNRNTQLTTGGRSFPVPPRRDTQPSALGRQAMLAAGASPETRAKQKLAN